MKTTEQWWKEVSSNEAKMIDWLKDQYHGEVTAEARIRAIIDDYPEITARQKVLITQIANDEKRHAEWVAELLHSRGIPAEVLKKEERYWGKVLPKEKLSFEQVCAIGHLAEVMRLERIKLLASDYRFKDIADVFERILPDETFHAKAFGAMSTPECIEAARLNHNEGLNALGLVA